MSEDFTCAICERRINTRWSFRGRYAEAAPVCRYCEREYTSGIAAPSYGSFRDRREVMRGLALAEALRCAAMRKTWRRDYASA